MAFYTNKLIVVGIYAVWHFKKGCLPVSTVPPITCIQRSPSSYFGIILILHLLLHLQALVYEDGNLVSGSLEALTRHLVPTSQYCADVSRTCLAAFNV